MKKFVFPLQTLLEIRSRIEESVKNELAKKNKEIFHAQEDLAGIKNKLAFLNKEQKKQRSERADIVSMRHSVTYRHKLTGDMVKKGEEIAGLRQEAEIVKKRLIKAKKEKRAIELVREKRFNEWKKQLKAEEQEFIDDISQKEYIRKKNSAARSSVLS